MFYFGCMINAKKISKSYGDLAVLKNISLEIKKGEIVSIIGPSGAGKTSLLQILGTLDNPTNSDVSIKINGLDILKLSPNKLAKFRNKHIGFIFQFHQLLPEFNALENVCIPAYIAGFDNKKAEKKAIKLLNFLGLKERYYHKPSELSGGEQQRVAVARALINEPDVIFADEPSGNLDSQSADNLHQLFLNLRDKFGYTFIIVTHNKDLAELSDRTLLMNDGQII